MSHFCECCSCRNEFKSFFALIMHNGGGVFVPVYTVAVCAAESYQTSWKHAPPPPDTHAHARTLTKRCFHFGLDVLPVIFFLKGHFTFRSSHRPLVISPAGPPITSHTTWLSLLHRRPPAPKLFPLMKSQRICPAHLLISLPADYFFFLHSLK